MPDDWQPLEPVKAEMPRMELNLQPGQTGHDLPFDKAHHADYEAICHIRDNHLKKKQINSYLEQQHHEHSQRGWLAYDHVGVDRSLLTEAFREPADASRASIEMLCRRADDADAEASTCGARCGGECKGACKIKAIEVSADGHVFYMGSGQEILGALRSDMTCVTYVRDRLTIRHHRDVDKLLDRKLAKDARLDKLVLRPIHLRARENAVLWLCDIGEWAAFLIETLGNAGAELNLEPRYERHVNEDNEHVIGLPHTAEWQRIYEANVHDGLGSREFLIGLMASMDGTRLDGPGRRKLIPGYIMPENIPEGLRSFWLLWLPAFYLPVSPKVPEHETRTQAAARERIDRAVLNESLFHVFMPLNGIERVKYTVSDVERWAVFGLESLCLDGLEAMKIAQVRQNGKAPCERCISNASFYHLTYDCDVPQEHRRTNAHEAQVLRKAWAALRTHGHKTKAARFLQMQGYHLDCTTNAMSTVFGCDDKQWHIGRNIGVAPLHTNEEGCGRKTIELAFQGIQWSREEVHETPKADSSAAAKADELYDTISELASKVARATPSSLRHAGWQHDFTYFFTRDRGDRKPKLVYAQLRHCNAWHLQDLMKISVPVLLQPELVEAEDEPFVQQHLHLCVETICLFNKFYEAQRVTNKTERMRREMTILAREWIRSMEASHPGRFKVNYKPHKLACEAAAADKDIGAAHLRTEQRSEWAHKYSKITYRERTSHSFSSFVQQLATERNRDLAAFLLSVDAGKAILPSVEAKEHEMASEFSYTERVETLTLVVDFENSLKVIDLEPSFPFPGEVTLDVLLKERGFEHLYWCILCMLAPRDTLHDSLYERDELMSCIPACNQPYLKLRLQHGISVGQTGDYLSAAAPYVKVPPLERCEAFVAFVTEEGDLWYGLPMLAFQVVTLSGEHHDFIYVRYLSNSITGIERDLLPVPADFQAFQWDVCDQMGVGDPPKTKPYGFGLVYVQNVVHVAPIVQIGTLPSAIDQKLWSAEKKRRLAYLRSQGRRTSAYWPWDTIRPGALFILNYHAYIAVRKQK